mmetsp:Transcript_27593/g.49768  ORF Transcript_27593/g.49768 Transcript_27593/m.49768 type:complete len:183 (-) Transcript_27593:2812-3360(-)
MQFSSLPFSAMRSPTASYMPKHQLPPHLQTLFNPRPPLPFLKPPLKSKCRPYTGIAEYVDLFEEDTDDSDEQIELQEQQEEIPVEEWNANSLGLQNDPLKTLFVCRLNFETNERRLRREFEVFGPIVSVNIGSREATPSSSSPTRRTSRTHTSKLMEGKLMAGKSLSTANEAGLALNGSQED